MLALERARASMLSLERAQKDDKDDRCEPEGIGIKRAAVARRELHGLSLKP